MVKLNFTRNVDVTAQLKQESAVYGRPLPAEGALDSNTLINPMASNFDNMWMWVDDALTVHIN